MTLFYLFLVNKQLYTFIIYKAVPNYEFTYGIGTSTGYGRKENQPTSIL